MRAPRPLVLVRGVANVKAICENFRTSVNYNILLVYRNQPKRYRTAMIGFSSDSSLLLSRTPSPITQEAKR